MIRTNPGDVSAEMQTRLSSNRNGKLTTGQWKDMVTEPLVTLLVLAVPLMVILGPRLFVLTARGVGFAFLIVALFVFVPMLFRARRYARAPVLFDILYAVGERSSWMFWRPLIFRTEEGVEMRFTKRLAPGMRLKRGHPYFVYYLRDPGNLVLLSLVPADHPDADQWQPSPSFEVRRGHRAGSSKN
jgi:hypothetical protein